MRDPRERDDRFPTRREGGCGSHVGATDRKLIALRTYVRVLPVRHSERRRPEESSGTLSATKTLASHSDAGPAAEGAALTPLIPQMECRWRSMLPP